MKELSIEEKAKRYDEALKRARKIENGEPINVPDGTSIPAAIFPELYESEGERIRKQIISFLKEFECDHYRCLDFSSWIAWLEKQGEQKSVDNVKPKFKVGDWVAENEPNNYARFIHILEIINVQGKDRYRISRDIHNDEDIVDFDFVEKYYHIFDVKDAKDGDVLWHSDSASNGIFIFKEIRHDGKVLCYCDYDSEDHFCLGEHHTCCWINDKYIKPATKEQSYLLFKKMKEAGYKWNVDEKELIKL